MKILELFCGTKSFSKVAEERGHEVMMVDIEKKFNPTIVCDIMDFKIEMLNGFKPDVIWASPPCTTFSVASIGKHWKQGIPKTKEAWKGIEILGKTVEIIEQLQPTFWFVENPRGMMRKYMSIKNRHTVTYCQYGDTRMKPTDIWTNLEWTGKKCKNGDKCHIPAPRGSKTGTQGIKGAELRGVIPKPLCEEIIKHCEESIK